MALDPAYIALIGTLCGGIGLKVAEHYLGKNNRRSDDASRIRDELRIEITNLREDRKSLEGELEELRERYYALYEKFIAQTTELTLALQKIGTDAQKATAKAEEISSILPPTPSPPTGK